MSRLKLILPKEILQKAIEDAENINTFDNRSALYAVICDSLKTCKDEKGNERTLTPSVIDLRVREYGIELKTPKGVRGNILNTRPKKEESFRRRKDFIASKEAMEKHFKDKPKLVKKVLNGSMASAIKLNCLECVSMCVKEAARCEMVKCPFYHFSPFIDHSKRDKDGKMKEIPQKEETVESILEEVGG